MKKPILIVLHQEQSSPGRVGYALRQRGYELDIRRPPLGDALPETAAEHSGMVVFGGPMSANDEANHPWILGVMDLIRSYGEAGRPVLGICLGAQLIARSFGGQVRRAAEQERQVRRSNARLLAVFVDQRHPPHAR